MLLIKKEKGLSSFEIIRELRKILNIKKIGHAGTLDPLAEGLLIVLVDKEETKKAQEFLGLDKTYEAVARLGIRTDTGDLEGKIIEKKDDCNAGNSEIKYALSSLKGSHEWEVPLYSAVKVNGKPLYKYAREGQTVQAPKKKMQIYKIELVNIKRQGKYIDIHYKAKVSSGTYIRTLSEKLGEKLNCPATTAFIKRTAIGQYSIQDAKTLNEVRAHKHCSNQYLKRLKT